MEYRYSTDEEFFNFESEEECLDSIINNSNDSLPDLIGQEVVFWKGKIVEQKSSDFVTTYEVDSFLEALNERANSECGESAEDFAYNVPKEAQEELLKFMEEWSDKHLQCWFYAVTDVEEVKVVITQDIINECCGVV